mgnify:CR=1 FL=1
MMKWARYFIEETSSISGRKLLPMDNFVAHKATDVVDFLHSNNTVVCFLPPNMTHVCQPLDLRINRPFKLYLANLFFNRQQQRYRESLALSTPPLREDMIEWIVQACSSLTSRIVISGFMAAGLIDSEINEGTIERQLVDAERVDNLLDLDEEMRLYSDPHETFQPEA